MTTKDNIISAAVKQFALSSPDGFSMRALAAETGIVQSVLYHYFSSKEVLLKEMFDTTNTKLGKARAKLPQLSSPLELLEQRVTFQLDHAQEIVAVLKYYLAFRAHFKKKAGGYVPEKAYLHIEEVLQAGITARMFDPAMNVAAEAKVMTHAINGFLLEYYPQMPRGQAKRKLINEITAFLARGIPKYVS